MIQITTATYLVMLVATVYAFWKFVIPRCWKFGVLFIRTVFMFIEARRNMFPLWPVFKALPKTWWRVWASDMNARYEFSEVCCFSFRSAEFESPLTTDQPWLDSLAVLLRQNKTRFTMTFPSDSGEAMKLNCSIRLVKFNDLIVKVFVIENPDHAGNEALIAHALYQLIGVLEYYTPDVFAVMVKTASGRIEYISTIEAETIQIDGEDCKLFMIVNSTVYQEEMNREQNL